MNNTIDISLFDYPLPAERIAKFPLEQRDDSKLLIYNGAEIGESTFRNIGDILPTGATLVFNNTKVVRARLIFYKESGARIEIFCLEPHLPADYERAFAVTGSSSWHCIVGNSKKWKSETTLQMSYPGGLLLATKGKGDSILFEWSSEHTFGQVLEIVGNTPIPPYLDRESEPLDTIRYQTVYSLKEGSVAAPTAGLHFTEEILKKLPEKGFDIAKVTLHVGAGTFLPVKVKDARDHEMHTEIFDVQFSEIKRIADNYGNVIAVGTTSVRTIESLAVLGCRVILGGDAMLDRPIGQWEAYEYQEAIDFLGKNNDKHRPDLDSESEQKSEFNRGSESKLESDAKAIDPLKALVDWCEKHEIDRIIGATQIMITPGYRFMVVRGIITNFHQPKSTLLLLISALVGDAWREIYSYALENDFRFLSYGDSSLLMPK